MRLPRLFLLLALTTIGVPLLAQDAPPVDPAAVLKRLHRIRDEQNTKSTQSRLSVLQQVNAAASSPEKATALWEEAVRAVQFSGAAKENAAYRDWWEKEGEGLNGAYAKNALRLYFNWLSLTIQRDGGTPVRDLVPQVLAYTKDLMADEQAGDALDEMIKKEKTIATAQTIKKMPPPVGAPKKATDDMIRKMHDQILKRPIANSPVALALKLADFVNAPAWEKTPGNFDGIYQQILLPEFRDNADPRGIEYWELRIRRDGEIAARSGLVFDIEKYNTLRRPSLLWSRAEEMVWVGYRNRAINDMIAIIEANPGHQDSPVWARKLEEMLVPGPAVKASEGDKEN